MSCSGVHPLPPASSTGPATLSDILRWPYTFLKALKDFDAKQGTGYYNELSDIVVGKGPGVVLTTSVTGSGGAETALAMLRAAVKDANAGAGDGSHT